MNRRDVLGTLSMAGGASMLGSTQTLADALAPASVAGSVQAVTGTAPVKIRDIKTILTAPNRIRLVVVKVETTEPGLVGWGCATFTQRALVVQTAIEQYLKPFLIGRNVDEIEDIWQSSYVSSYWRNGPTLFNAMSGVDIALWDIKGKRAGMPLYQLLGGKVRHGADCYYHASGATFAEVEDSARRGMSLGFREVRVQEATPGLAGYGDGGGGAAAAGAAPNEAGGWTPVWLWGPGEQPLADAVIAASSNTSIAAPATGVADLVALARASALVISGDTGPLHIATAVGAPTVSIFGPTDPNRNGPYAVGDVAVSRFETCGCHYDRRCHEQAWCLGDVTVAEVCAAVQRRLQVISGD